MTHHDRQHIFILLSCSEIRKFEEGILGGKWYCQNAKCEATQIYLLAENPEQAYPKSSKFKYFRKHLLNYIYCTLLAYVRI